MVASVVSEALKCARERAAAKGHAPGHFNDGTAPGYRMGLERAARVCEEMDEHAFPFSCAAAIRALGDGA